MGFLSWTLLADNDADVDERSSLWYEAVCWAGMGVISQTWLADNEAEQRCKTVSGNRKECASFHGHGSLTTKQDADERWSQWH